MHRCLLPLCLTVVVSVLQIGSLQAELKQVGSEVEVSGRIADMAHSTQTSGYRFNVGLTGLSYQGRVDRTLLEQKEEGDLTVWVALRDVVLTIGSTSISGKPGSATCGPLAIQMGHRRDLWVAFDFKIQGEAADVSLTLSDTRFALPADNWSVGSPAWVRTSGFGMSRSKVVNGLRSGIVDNKATIEQRLIGIAPTILAEVAPVPKNTPIDRQSIAPAVQQKLVTEGLLTMQREVAKAEG